MQRRYALLNVHRSYVRITGMSKMCASKCHYCYSMENYVHSTQFGMNVSFSSANMSSSQVLNQCINCQWCAVYCERFPSGNSRRSSGGNGFKNICTTHAVWKKCGERGLVGERARGGERRGKLVQLAQRSLRVQVFVAALGRPPVFSASPPRSLTSEQGERVKQTSHLANRLTSCFLLLLLDQNRLKRTG